IRDFHVTGVQTCALPILLELSLNRLDCWLSDRSIWRSTGIPAALTATRASTLSAALAPAVAWLQAQRNTGVRRRLGEAHACVLRSEERRVGEESRAEEGA